MAGSAIHLPNNAQKTKFSEKKTGQFAKQVAQLSHRGRAMLRVIEYFAKSLKASQGQSK